MPVNAMHEERKLAPARMKRIMQERRVAPIRLLRVPAAASEPRQVFSSYPRFFSSGSATLAIVAQVAAEDPDTVPNTAQPRILTCIRRPGSQPSQGERPSNISSDRRVR